MNTCKNCESLIPFGLIQCPNCETELNLSQKFQGQVKKVLYGLSVTSVSMTLMACYGQSPKERERQRKDSPKILALALLSPKQAETLKITLTGLKDLGVLKLQIQGNELSLEPEKKSKIIVISKRIGNYSITDATGKVLFSKSDFDFGGNLKDGIFLKEDSFFDFTKTSDCYDINGMTGKLILTSCPSS